MKPFILCIALMLMATGCKCDDESPRKTGTQQAKKKDDKGKADKDKKADKKSATKPTPPKPDKALLALAETLKTSEDFEEEAEREISLENLEAELDKLQAEITQGPK